MNLPEHEKLKDVQPFSQAIGNFLEWLQSRGIELCRYATDAPGILIPIDTSIEKLLAEHFEIDLNELEREKLAILDAHRKTMESDAA